MNHRATNLVVLTGAGVSAESGIRTFRATDGLWEDHRIEDVASPEGYQRDPALIHKFYNERRSSLLAAEPNQAHLALAKFEKVFNGNFLLVTQNIDDLHERSGSRNLIHMHGELLKAHCDQCGDITEVTGSIEPQTTCEECNKGYLRPHIVWFGEMPLLMDKIQCALNRCDTFISIGTSGLVYPAAGFVQIAKSVGAYCIEANLESSSIADGFDDLRQGLATEIVGPLLEELVS